MPCCTYAGHQAVNVVKDKITKEGQEYVDDPVYTFPKPKSAISRAVSHALDPNAPPPKPILLGHERVTLRWMKPDGKGGLVPKYQKTKE